MNNQRRAERTGGRIGVEWVAKDRLFACWFPKAFAVEFFGAFFAGYTLGN